MGGLTENFNMAEIDNPAIPGGSRPPVPPLDPPMVLDDAVCLKIKIYHQDNMSV